MNTIPAILEGSGRNSSISMERALKQIKDLLVDYGMTDPDCMDRIEASIDDVEFMLKRVEPR